MFFIFCQMLICHSSLYFKVIFLCMYHLLCTRHICFMLLLYVLLYGLFFSVVLIFIHVEGMYGAPYGIFAFFTVPNLIYFNELNEVL